jgi:hypothetical protein
MVEASFQKLFHLLTAILPVGKEQFSKYACLYMGYIYFKMVINYDHEFSCDNYLLSIRQVSVLLTMSLSSASVILLCA